MCQGLSICHLNSTLRITLQIRVMIPITQKENWDLDKKNGQATWLIKANSHMNSPSRSFENKTQLSTNCPLWHHSASYGLCRTRRGSRAHSKVSSWKTNRASSAAIGSTSKGLELESWVTLSEEIESGLDTTEDCSMTVPGGTEGKISPELNMFHLGRALNKVKQPHISERGNIENTHIWKMCH